MLSFVPHRKQIEIFKGFLKRATDVLRVLFACDRPSFDPDIVPLLNLMMFILGECPRCPENEEFVVANFDVPRFRLAKVTDRLNKLIHNWSALSKIAFKFFIAIVEFDMGFRGSRSSFDEARRMMHDLVDKNGIVLEFEGADGTFNLRSLLGTYLRVLKCEKEDIVRIIMRTTHGITNEIPEYKPKLEEQVDLAKEPLYKQIKALRRKNSDSAEYLRWQRIRNRDKKLINVLLDDLPVV